MIGAFEIRVISIAGKQVRNCWHVHNPKPSTQTRARPRSSVHRLRRRLFVYDDELDLGRWKTCTCCTCQFACFAVQ